ncbi:hypothetical protein DL768_010157 [Monosporascus sp. mg162]|nr:hypothetical protein DL768_010157 [Monosporascus sp. mg162]
MDIEETEYESRSMEGNAEHLHWESSVDNKNYTVGAVEGLTFESVLVHDDPGANAAAIKVAPSPAAGTNSETIQSYDGYLLEHPRGLLSSAIASRKPTVPRTWPDESSVYGRGNDAGWNVSSSGQGIATPNSTAFSSFPGFGLEGISDHLVDPYNSVFHPSPGALASSHTGISGYHPSGLQQVQEGLEEDSIDGLSSPCGGQALPSQSQKIQDHSWEVPLNTPTDQHHRVIGGSDKILLSKKDLRRHQEQSRRVEPGQWTCNEPRCASFGKTYNRLDNYNRHIKKVHARFADDFAISRYCPWKPAHSASNTSL